MEARLANLERLSHDGHSAGDLVSLAELDQILRLAETTSLSSRPKTAQSLVAQIARAKEALSSDVRAMTEQPLTAELYWEKRAPLLQRAPLRESFMAGVAEMRTSGQQACSRLSSANRRDKPFQAALIRRYCAHFVETTTKDAPEQTRTDIVIQTNGVPTEQQDVIRQTLLRVIAQTPWSSSVGSAPLKVTVDGTYGSTQTDQTVVLHGRFTDYHLAYPILPVGRGTIMVVPQTEDYPYEAKDHWRRYEANLQVTVSFSNQARPFSRTFRKGESLRGRDHHVTFEPADIHPVHTSVPSADNWLVMEFGAFANDLRESLEGYWVDTYCKASQYSVENAARCLLGGQTSEPVLTSLARAVGEDNPAVARLAAGVTSAP